MNRVSHERGSGARCAVFDAYAVRNLYRVGGGNCRKSIVVNSTDKLSIQKNAIYRLDIRSRGGDNTFDLVHFTEIGCSVGESFAMIHMFGCDAAKKSKK